MESAPPFKTRVLTLIKKRRIPEYGKNLNLLSRNGDWKELVRQNPRKDLEANMSGCASLFDWKEHKTLSLSLKGKTSALIFEKSERPGIMVVDWGIGGLPVFRALSERLTGKDFLYVSDSGFTPYGRVSEKELLKRSEELEEVATRLGIGRMVIACNALSSVQKGTVRTTGKSLKSTAWFTIFLRALMRFPRFALIDPSDALVRKVIQEAEAASGSGRRVFLTTGKRRQSEKGAALAFGIYNIRFREVPLDLSRIGPGDYQ